MSYYESHKEKIKKKARDWALANPERRREIWRKWNKRHHWENRIGVLNHYSEGKNSCKCCGEKDVRFLSIDHLNGGGNKHRRSLKSEGGIQFYRWLARNGYPAGYSVLCFNCNMAKGIYGFCPHGEK